MKSFDIFAKSANNAFFLAGIEWRFHWFPRYKAHLTSLIKEIPQFHVLFLNPCFLIRVDTKCTQDMHSTFEEHYMFIQMISVYLLSMQSTSTLAIISKSIKICSFTPVKKKKKAEVIPSHSLLFLSLSHPHTLSTSPPSTVDVNSLSSQAKQHSSSKQKTSNRHIDFSYIFYCFKVQRLTSSKNHFNYKLWFV